MSNDNDQFKSSESDEVIKDPLPIKNVFEESLERRSLSDDTLQFLSTYCAVNSAVLPDSKEWAALETEVKNIVKHALIHRSQAYANWRKRQPDIFSYASSLPSNLTLVHNCFAADQPYSLMDLPFCTMPKVYNPNIDNEAKLHEIDGRIDFKKVCKIDTSRIINLFYKRFQSIDEFATPFDPQLDTPDYYLLNKLFTIPDDGNINNIAFHQEETLLPKFSNLSKIGYEFALDPETDLSFTPEKRALVCPYHAEKQQKSQKNKDKTIGLDANISVPKSLLYLSYVQDPLELNENEFLDDKQLEDWIKQYLLGQLDLTGEQAKQRLLELKAHYSPLIGPIGKESVKANNRTINIVKKYKPKSAHNETREKRDELLDRVLAAYKEQDESKTSKRSGRSKDNSLIFEDTFKAMHDLAGSTSSKLVLEESLAAILQENPHFDRIIEEGFYLARHGEMFGLCAVAISYILQNDETKGERAFRSNYDKALLYLELAAANREPYSCYLLSYLASKGIYRHLSDKELNNRALTYLIRAADDGLDIAQIDLALRYKKMGHHIELYGHYILLAARQGNPFAWLESERVVSRGLVASPDSDLGWFLLALYATYVPNDIAIFNKVGQKFLKLYNNNPEVYALNKNTGVRMLERAAFVSVDACYFVGMMYYEGSAVRQDYCKARYYFDCAARFDYGNSKVLLGGLYERGEGGDCDLNRALDLYKDSLQHDKYGMAAEAYIELLLTVSLRSGYPFEVLEGIDLVKSLDPEHQVYWTVRKEEMLKIIDNYLYNAPFTYDVLRVYEEIERRSPDMVQRLQAELKFFNQKNKIKLRKNNILVAY